VHAFEILGDPVRRRIVELLGDGEQRVLRENGFATVRASGARRLYAVDATPLQEVDQWLQPYRHFWDQRLDALGVEIARGKRTRRASKDTPNRKGGRT
jgi:hypothetical protein